MITDMTDDHEPEQPAVPVVPDWAMQRAMRLIGDDEEHIAAARERINAQVLAELQGSTNKAKALVDKLLNAGADESRLIAAVDAAVLDELRAVSERHLGILEIVATNTATLAGVLRRNEARFEVFAVPAAASGVSEIIPPTLTSAERMEALGWLMGVHDYLMNLRDADLLDLGVLLFVVAVGLVWLAYAPPTKGS